MAAKVNPIRVQKYLKDIDYPGDKKKLVDTAKEEGADAHVMDTLNRLPKQKYNSPNDEAEGIGDLDAPTASEHHRRAAERTRSGPATTKKSPTRCLVPL